jgi:membrane protease YdiL (CAAX protease family)
MHNVLNRLIAFNCGERKGPCVVDKRISSLVEVIIVMITLDLLVAAWIFSGLSQLEDALYWSYFGHVLYVAVPVLILVLTSRNLKTYGLTLSNWRYNMKWGVLLILVVIIPIMITVAMGLTSPEQNLSQSDYVVSTLIFQFLFAGFGEEILFRGYYQSRLNEGFGRNFRVLNLEFGWGVFITAFLFGMVHVFFWPRFFFGGFQINVMSGIYTGMIGLTIGFVREKSGSILAPSLMHGIWDCTVVFLVQADIFTVVSIVGWVACTIIVFIVFARTQLVGQEKGSEFESSVS